MCIRDSRLIGSQARRRLALGRASPRCRGCVAGCAASCDNWSACPRIPVRGSPHSGTAWRGKQRSLEV
eukprot:14883459-Alexandrium_andersonii.AAC.1